MSHEILRAAAERIRGRCIAANNADPALADAAMLAGAYLAEHPADDAEPVTPEWLRSIGFAPDGNPDGPNPPLAISLFYGRTDEEIESGTDIGRHLLIDRAGAAMLEEYSPGGRVLDSIILPDLPTRGHVRRLLAALDIPPA